MKKGIAWIVLAAASISVADATQIRFFTGSGASSSVNGSTYVTPFATPNCNSGTDFCGATLTYNLGGGLSLTASASGTGSTAVIQDASPANGGLGDNGTAYGDNIGGSSEFVRLVFNQTVNLTGFFSFWDHNLPNGTSSITTLNNVNYNSNGNNWITTNLTGTTFTFKRYADGYSAYDYGMYVSALKFTSVPEPATMGLFGLGLAAIGFVRRRRTG